MRVTRARGRHREHRWSPVVAGVSTRPDWLPGALRGPESGVGLPHLYRRVIADSYRYHLLGLDSVGHVVHQIRYRNSSREMMLVEVEVGRPSLFRLAANSRGSRRLETGARTEFHMIKTSMPCASSPARFRGSAL